MGVAKHHRCLTTHGIKINHCIQSMRFHIFFEIVKRDNYWLFSYGSSGDERSSQGTLLRKLISTTYLVMAMMLQQSLVRTPDMTPIDKCLINSPFSHSYIGRTAIYVNSTDNCQDGTQPDSGVLHLFRWHHCSIRLSVHFIAILVISISISI